MLLSTRRPPPVRWAVAGVVGLLAALLAGCGGEAPGGINVIGAEVDTQQAVEVGQTVRITARGTVDFGGGFAGFGDRKLSADGDDGLPAPDAPAPNLRRDSLIVRIGDVWYQGGVDSTIVSASSGDVVLRANNPTSTVDGRGWAVGLEIADPAPGTAAAAARTFDRLPLSGGPLRTGVHVDAGSTVHLVATGILDVGKTVAGGSTRVNPDGNDDVAPRTYLAPNLRPGSLIAQIDGVPAWYQGGSDATFVPAASGLLDLAVNDDDVEDNTQTWFVSGQITPPAPEPGPVLGPFTVSNTKVETGFSVAAGQRIHVESRGRMNLGGGTAGGDIRGDVVDAADGDGPGHLPPPDYPAKDLVINSLVIQIGATYYQGGNSVDVVARQAGLLSLLPNDVIPEDNRSVLNDDVHGWYVTVTPAAAAPASGVPRRGRGATGRPAG